MSRAGIQNNIASRILHIYTFLLAGSVFAPGSHGFHGGSVIGRTFVYQMDQKMSGAVPHATISSSGDMAALSQPQLLVSRIQHLASAANHDEDASKIRLILASQSPRRREILDMMGLKGKFDATPSPLDEEALASQLLRDGTISCPKVYTRTLAEEKAKALAVHLYSTAAEQGSLLRQPTLVLGSDTIVDLDDHILEKPLDREDAKRMLRRLSGVQHAVHTGVALYRVLPPALSSSTAAASDDNPVVLVGSFTDTSLVTFAQLSEPDIDAYVASGEPMDKSGSYGIQGIGGQLVRSVEGDFFTVMGLPMHRTSQVIAGAITDILSVTER